MAPPVTLSLNAFYGTAISLVAGNKVEDAPFTGQDDFNLYFFFGVNHAIPEQHLFFNELLVKGRDALMLDGVQVVSMESFQFGEQSPKSVQDAIVTAGNKAATVKGNECDYDLQGYIDSYMQTGNQQVLSFLGTCLTINPPYKPQGQIIEPILLQSLMIASGNYIEPGATSYHYDFYAADLYYKKQKEIETAGFARHQLLEIRDYNAVQFLLAKLFGKSDPVIEVPHTPAAFQMFLGQRVERGKSYVPLPKDVEQVKAMFAQAIKDGKVIFGEKNIYVYLQGIVGNFRKQSTGKVVMAEWGSSHVEKEGLPKYLPAKEQSLSIIITGGAYDTKLIFDEVVREMGLENEMFVWVLPDGVRDADIIVHLPVSKGKKIEYIKQPPNGFEPQGVVTRLRCGTCY
ncbi:MAG: hypothetical protein NT099_03425 [Candidatus Saganbacteria bacterium]|nr:hypothetical protein [Candidatus Saganbacteria bacterium]